MTTLYFRRYRLEYFAPEQALPPAQLPQGYCWIPWSPTLIERHAWVKCQSFQHEIDAVIFDTLGDYGRCLRLMREIAQHTGFVPAATWLIARKNQAGQWEDCATIQGVMVSETLGGIQNVGVLPNYRRQGLGRALVLKALDGFLCHGARRIYLEVTASNEPAISLYQSLGFRHVRTLYRPVHAESARV
ncbi:MAG: N-acetyltransferase [Planctomycetaceae bacterium]|nr:MAG: N-acetyltransferase [Planctomycetaceae bacterium]